MVPLLVTGTWADPKFRLDLESIAREKMEAEAKAAVLKDPRVASRATTMQGFAGNIGKYVSLAYLEAEKEAF